MLPKPTPERQTLLGDYNRLMESNESDIKGSGLSPSNPPMYLELARPKVENLGQDEALSLEGSLQLQPDTVTSRQQFSLTKNIGAESNVKEIPTSMTNLPMLSGLYCTEGAVKEFGNLSGLNNNAAFPGTHPSGVSAGNPKRSWLPQKSQTYQGRTVDPPKEQSSQGTIRVARPPAEGRGKTQLLPRYWPRITDQELQQLTAKDSNCTITPLFEKILSASDAGRVGRLVLPKACAEAYFPPISQAEGVPLAVQDVSGKEWVFQFRFWPNNNSRMYVLEGITPCIQSMQLQAGDTVIFSRLEPEGKLVMGYRRAPNNQNNEEPQKSTIMASSQAGNHNSTSGSTDKFSNVGALPNLLSQSTKAHVNKSSGQYGMQDSHLLQKAGMPGSKKRESSRADMLIMNEKKKAKEAVSKNKRSRADTEHAEFKRNWEEAQSLLQSPPNVVPTIVTIEGYDFEEYEEPPVFGKGPLSANPAPNPPNVVQEPENDKSNDKSETVSQQVKAAAKKPEVSEPIPLTSEPLSGLEALATLATVEDNSNAASSSSPATTTKHPRHRPGCSCIVCIQPPSGKGPKHKPNCDCNVCVTVKRRFHTLMLRRKKLQSEREAENATQKKQLSSKEILDMNAGLKRSNDVALPKIWPFSGPLPRVNDAYCNGNGITLAFPPAARIVKVEYDTHLPNKGPQIDLNSQPEREEDVNRGSYGFSMKSLLQSASYPLDMYLKQQGLTSLICNDQMSVTPDTFPRNAVDKKVEEPDIKPMTVHFNADSSQEERYVQSKENVDQIIKEKVP